MKHIEKSLIENDLWPEDVVFFNKIEKEYTSDNERIFFETLYKKMQTELAPCKELLLPENSNEDEVYILRDQYDEFIVGQGIGNKRKEEIHTMRLSDALNINMKERGFLDDDITLLDWLRRNDYKGLQYNHNYAYL